MQRIHRFLIVISLMFSSVAIAENNLRMEMMSMGENLVMAFNAEQQTEFRQNIRGFIEAAEKSQVIIPSHLKNEPSQIVGYQKGMQIVIDLAKESEELALSGDLKGAKEKLGQIPELRKRYHSVYKQ
ncbi:cytochrome b562 [Rodentibacter caecimuris]|uniref:Cytochrome B562 n=1 Tax=Rodentibacter caecimuris TaxID=1796644 RepID=A0ABX3KZ23_9PAST|nr:hypothetical protein BKG89_01890 [Rodentibacter heylii]